MKKNLLTLSLALSPLFGELVFISPDTNILKDSYVQAYQTDKDYFGFSLGLFDKFELFSKDKKTNSLYGAKILLQKESDGLPSLTYTMVESNSSKRYITLGKKISFMEYFLGYENSKKRFYGGLHFLYSKDLTLSYQYDESHHDNFWFEYHFFSGSYISIGRFNKKNIVWFKYKLNLANNYIKEIGVENKNRDELENIFNQVDSAYEDINYSIQNHGITEKVLWINTDEFNAFKSQKVSKTYMSKAIEIKREYKTSGKFDFELFINPSYSLIVSKTKPSKSNFFGNIGTNIGGGGKLPLFISYWADISHSKSTEKIATLNFITNKQTNFFRAEVGHFTKKDGYDLEYMKTFYDERFAYGLSMQKQGSLKSNFLSLFYIPKISKNILVNLKVGKFFHDSRALEIGAKKFYKDATLGAKLFLNDFEKTYRLKVYITLPLNYKKVSISPTLYVEKDNVEKNYIDSQNSFENTIFDRNNITIQRVNIDY